MGLFSDTTFEEGRKLYYKDSKAGITMMKSAAKSERDFRILEAKAWEAKDKETEIFAATERAKKAGAKKFDLF